MAELIYKELSYKIVGLTHEVYNKLKYGYQEKYYQRAFQKLLVDNKINHKRELTIPIVFDGLIIGRYFIDFVIDDKIVIEFKVGNDFYEQHQQQVLGYLKSSGMKLGMIVLFHPKGIKIKRIVN